MTKNQVLYVLVGTVLFVAAQGSARAFSMGPDSIILTGTVSGNSTTWDAASWTVYWEIPTASSPPLIAEATFGLDATSDDKDLVLNVSVTNTTRDIGPTERLTSFGFDIVPTPDPLSASTQSESGGIFDSVATNANLSGGYKLDICVFDAKCNSDQGRGLVAGAESDWFRLTLMTDSFANTSMHGQVQYTLSTFAAKFQGDQGSFEVPGTINGCANCKPGSAASVLVSAPVPSLLLLGCIATLLPLRRRQRASC